MYRVLASVGIQQRGITRFNQLYDSGLSDLKFLGLAGRGKKTRQAYIYIEGIYERITSGQIVKKAWNVMRNWAGEENVVPEESMEWK